jgi:hypothetical protein
MSGQVGKYKLPVGKNRLKTGFLQGTYSLLHLRPQPQIFPVILPSKKFRFDVRVFKEVDNEMLYNMSTYQTFHKI